MNKPDSERTLQILDLISKSPDLSQRDLALATGLSLGLVNLILRRMIHNGYIKVSNLNRKKVHYLLTPRGFLEKAHRSYVTIAGTIKSYVHYERQLTRMISSLIAQKYNCFAVLGHNEVSELVEMILREFSDHASFRSIEDKDMSMSNEFVLDCRHDNLKAPALGIHVLSALLEMTQNQSSAAANAPRNDMAVSAEG